MFLFDFRPTFNENILITVPLFWKYIYIVVKTNMNGQQKKISLVRDISRESIDWFIEEKMCPNLNKTFLRDKAHLFTQGHYCISAVKYS